MATAALRKQLPLIPGAAWDHLLAVGRSESPAELVQSCRQLLRSLDEVPLFSGDAKTDHAAVVQLFHFHTQLKAAIEACMARQVCGNTMLAAPLSGLVKLHVRMQDPVDQYQARLDLALLMLKTGCVPDEIRLAIQLAHLLVMTRPDSADAAVPEPAVQSRLKLAGQLLERAEASLGQLEEPQLLHLFNTGLLSCDLCLSFGVADLCSSENPLPPPEDSAAPEAAAAEQQPSVAGEAKPEEQEPAAPPSATTGAAESSSDGISVDGSDGGVDASAGSATPHAAPASSGGSPVDFTSQPSLVARANGSAICVALLSRRLGTLLMHLQQREGAVRHLRQAVSLLQQHLPPTHAAYLELPVTRVSLGVLLGQMGQMEGQAQLAAARPEFLRFVSHHPELQKDPRFVEQYAKYLNLYAFALAAAQPVAEAARVVAEAPEEPSNDAGSAEQDSPKERFSQVKALADEAIELLETTFGLANDSLVKCCSNMGQICEDNKELQLAAGYYGKALAGLEGLFEPPAAKKKKGRGAAAKKPLPAAVSEQLLVLNKLTPILQRLATAAADGSEEAGDAPAERQEWIERAAQAAQKTQQLQAVWEKLQQEQQQSQPQQPTPTHGQPKKSAASPDKMCAGPGCGLPDTPALPLKRCAGCRKVWYCGSACQKKHFKAGHKQDCHKD